jgi:hypothetical protein
MSTMGTIAAYIIDLSQVDEFCGFFACSQHRLSLTLTVMVRICGIASRERGQARRLSA